MYFSRKLNGIATTWPVPVRGRRVATAASRSDSAIFAQEADLLLSASSGPVCFAPILDDHVILAGTRKQTLVEPVANVRFRPIADIRLTAALRPTQSIRLGLGIPEIDRSFTVGPSMGHSKKQIFVRQLRPTFWTFS